MEGVQGLRGFFKETLGEDRWTKGGEEMKRGSRE